MEVPGSKLVAVNGHQHHKTLLNRLWGLVRSREKVDFGLAGCGRQLQAHRLILGVFFPPEKLFSVGNQHWEDCSLDLLIEFVYLGSLSVPEWQLDTLLDLATQLDFVMLVDALNAAKNSINEAKTAAPSPRPRTKKGRINPDTGFSSDPPSPPPTVTSHFSKSTTIEEQPPNGWIPVVPKLEMDSDHLRSTNSVVDRAFGRRRGDAARLAPEVDADTDYNVHLASVSVSIEEVACSEVKLEKFDCVEEFEAGDPSDPSVGIHISVPGAQYSVDRGRLHVGGGGLGADKLHDEVTKMRIMGPTIGLDSLDPNHGSNHYINERGFRCSVCRLVFEEHGQLVVHFRLHTGERPFKCNLCTRTFADVTSKNKHVRVHTEEKHYKCSVCSKAFRQPCELKNHARTHTGEKPYKCDVCAKEFTNLGNYNVHMRTHTGEKPYVCHVCRKAFASVSNLNVHTRLHFRIRAVEKPVTLDEYPRNSADSYAGIKRTGSQPAEEKHYKCNVCFRGFSQLCNLKNHVRTHTGEKPYKCNVCEKEFTNLGNFTVHTRLHTGEKPYKCRVCQKGFANGSNLKKHLRVHVAEIPIMSVSNVANLSVAADT